MISLISQNTRLGTLPDLEGKNDNLTGVMRLLQWLTRRYFFKVLIVNLSALFAVLSENIGLMLLIPIFQTTTQADLKQEGMYITTLYKDFFEMIGVPFKLIPLLLFFCLTIYLKSALMISLSFVKQRFVNIASMEIRDRLFRSLNHANWSYLNTLPSGVLSNLAANEINRTRQSISASMGLSTGVLAVLAYMLVALFMSWQVVLISFAVGLVTLIVTRPLRRVTFREGVRQTDEMGEMSRLLVEVISAIKVLKAMHRQKAPLALLYERNKNLFQSLIRSDLSNILLKEMREPIIVTVLSILAFLALGVLGTDAVVLGVILLIQIRLLNQLWQVNASIQSVGNLLGSANSVFKQINTAESHKEDLNESGIKVDFSDLLEFRSVTLGYNNEPLVYKASAAFPHVGLSVVMGASGSGKSTLINAILGFHAPLDGGLYIDGHIFNSINLKHWREQIGFVPQEVVLFADSLRNNVSFGDPTLDDAAIIKALQAAEIWSFFEETGQGLDFRIEDSGGNLSGGQRQRVSLARALVRSPRLLILDEATSALDAESKSRILSTLAKLANHTSIVAVTHDMEFEKIATQTLHIENKKLKNSMAQEKLAG